MANLLDKLRNKSARLGVVGLGYVGLPLAVAMARAGFEVLGIDVSEKKTERVRAGKNYIGDIDDAALSDVVARGKLTATTDFAAVGECDAVCICVPSPLDTHQEPDISYVRSAAEGIAPYLHKEMLIVLESTTYPGTTEELLLPIFARGGMRCGRDFYLAFSPERVDPGNAVYKTDNTPKIVGGVTPARTDAAATMYEQALSAPIHRVSSPAVAEMDKILENTYRNVNIGLINELAMLCNRMGIDIWEVIEAAKTKPYGFQAFYPGPGLGGHCIPLDPYYLSWKAREYSFHTSMIESSMMVNDRMPEYCVERLMHLLNKERKAINGANVLVLGVAFKANIDDCRVSPAIRVIEELAKVGAEVRYFDPYVPHLCDGELEMMGEPALTRELIERADAVMITTAHDCVDYALVAEHAKLVFDTRNAMKNCAARKNIVRL